MSHTKIITSLFIQMKVVLLSTFLLLISIELAAQDQTFVREYTYNASDMDSRISCRTIAINQIRSLLLHEIGVYVESEQILKTSEVGSKFSQDFTENIATISAGVTKLDVLEEKWNGEVFWIKASIVVDPKSLEEDLKKLVNDRQKVREFEDLKERLESANNELALLRLEQKKVGSRKDDIDIQKKYNSEINILKSGDFFYNGNAKHQSKDYQGAVDDYTKAIEFNPKYESAYYNRGVSKLLLLNYDGAIADFTKAIEAYPAFASAYTNRGVSRANLQDYKSAIVDYTHAIEIDQMHVPAYYNRGNAMSKLHDYGQAIADYSKAIEIDPNHSNAYNNRGRSKFEIQDYSGSIVDYTQAIEINPNMAIYFYNRARSKMQLGQIEDGCFDLNRAAELGIDDAKEKLKEFCK